MWLNIFSLTDSVFLISPETIVYWYLNEDYIGSTQTFHEIALTPKPGNYVLTATDQEGNEVKQAIEILQASGWFLISIP